MSAIITEKFRLHNALQFYESFSEAAKNTYYLFIGKSTAYTSGTTGVPKAAQMTHKSLITSSKNSHVRWNITVNQRVCHGFPLFGKLQVVW